jgi:hypothetical protein
MEKLKMKLGASIKNNIDSVTIIISKNLSIDHKHLVKDCNLIFGDRESMKKYIFITLFLTTFMFPFFGNVSNADALGNYGCGDKNKKKHVNCLRGLLSSTPYGLTVQQSSPSKDGLGNYGCGNKKKKKHTTCLRRLLDQHGAEPTTLPVVEGNYQAPKSAANASAGCSAGQVFSIGRGCVNQATENTREVYQGPAGLGCSIGKSYTAQERAAFGCEAPTTLPVVEGNYQAPKSAANASAGCSAGQVFSIGRGCVNQATENTREVYQGPAGLGCSIGKSYTAQERAAFGCE